jgi:hypothetical protein
LALVKGLVLAEEGVPLPLLLVLPPPVFALPQAETIMLSITRQAMMLKAPRLPLKSFILKPSFCSSITIEILTTISSSQIDDQSIRAFSPLIHQAALLIIEATQVNVYTYDKPSCL